MNPTRVSMIPSRILFACLLLSALPVVGESVKNGSDTKPTRPAPPPQSVLDEISARGRLLAEEDQAASRASDAIQERSEAKGLAGAFIPYQQNDGWVIVVGDVPKGGDQFLTSVEAREDERGQYRVTFFSPPRKDTGWVVKAFRALEIALEKFKSKCNPEVESYNHALVPESNGDISVYMYPATRHPNASVMGSDARVLVRDDGSATVTSYHKSLLRQEGPPPEGTKMSLHTHVLDDLPNPMDVLWVMTRPSKLAEAILGQVFICVVMQDGSIAFVTYTDAFGNRPSDKGQEAK